MAIRLTSTLSTPFEYISKQDEAVDTECEDFDEKWQRYSEGAPGADCPLKDGIEPTVWELTPIKNSRQRTNLQGYGEKHGSLGLMVAYAAAGITSVKNLADEDGKPVKIERVREDGFWVVAERQIAMIPPSILIELGQKILTHESPNAD